MDPLSQGLVGAVVAQSCATKKTVRHACLAGAIAGMAPDLDVLIRSEVDSLLFIEYHRHFTHSLFFVPFGSLIVALFLWCIGLKGKLRFSTLYLFTSLGMLTHGLLDACTSYGTSLLWPFSTARISWNIISIIDPLFTVPLLCFVVFSLIAKQVVVARIGLAIGLCYLAVGYYIKTDIASSVTTLAYQRGHYAEPTTPEKLLLNPTIGNILLWRSVYRHQGHYYVDALRYRPFSNNIITTGKKIPVIDPEHVFPELDSVKQRRDIKRFEHFSQGYIYLDSRQENTIGDLRYGTLPNDDRTLWGITIVPHMPEAHVRYQMMRDIQKEDWQKLRNMLFP